MLIDTIHRQGAFLFRWRSYFVLCLVPLYFLAIDRPEPIETQLGAQADFLYESACIALAFAGLLLRIYCVGHVPAGTSGRNTRHQVAKTLNTTGLYSVTRNPLYLANAIVYIAVAAFSQSLFFVTIMLLFQIVYLERIIAMEEEFLRGEFGGTYEAWARRVPAFFPDLSKWTPPALGFSWRSAIRREYSTFFAITAVFFLVDQGRESLVHDALQVNPRWYVFFSIGTIIYLGVMALKKLTRVLAAPGR